MKIHEETPLERAQAKRRRIEQELAKSPDFHLYRITKSAKDRARMRRLLVQIPEFKLWLALTTSIERACRAGALPGKKNDTNTSFRVRKEDRFTTALSA